MKIVAFIGVLLGVFAQLDAPSSQWRNPIISCALKENEDPVKQFPYGDQVGMAAGLQEFCGRMQKRFSRSELSSREADQVYKALFAAKWLREGGYGMPSPDLPATKPLTLGDYKKRMALRKISENRYEAYYSYINCGTNYEYAQVWLEGGAVARQERLEAWSGLYPC